MILVPSLKGGGTEKVVNSIASNLDKSKFQVSLVVVDYSDPFFEVQDSNVKVIDLKKKSAKSAVRSIIRTIKQVSPDIVMSTSTHLNILLACSRAFLPKNILLMARESNVVSHNNQFSPYPKLFNFLIRRFYKNYDRIVCQSNDMKDDLIENYGLKNDNLVVINNPVNIEKIEKLSAAAIEGKQESRHGSVKFITIGRIHPQKGYDRIIEGLSKIKFDFEYWILGKGSEEHKSYLDNLVESFGLNDKVSFLGIKKNPFKYLVEADYYLFGSRFEGFPNVLLEAGACGLPIIAYDCPGGINEIIAHGKNGVMLEQNNNTGFVNAIQSAQSQDFDFEEIKLLTKSKFGVNKIISKYEETYEDLYKKRFA